MSMPQDLKETQSRAAAATGLHGNSDAPEAQDDKMQDDNDGGHAERAYAVLGTLALFFSAAIVFLAAIDRSASLWFMPISWHADRALWYLLALAAFVCGVGLLWSQRTTALPASAEGESAAEPPSRRAVFQRVVLYTRSDCPLCDDAKGVLAEFRDVLPAVQEIDIDADENLRERFNNCVPVVEFDGKVRFRGRINRVLLRRMIEAAGPPVSGADD